MARTAFLWYDLPVETHIKPNLTRHEDRLIDKERHLVECFFNRIQRFRRIALRRERTLSSFKAFVDLACAMAWLT